MDGRSRHSCVPATIEVPAPSDHETLRWPHGKVVEANGPPVDIFRPLTFASYLGVRTTKESCGQPIT